MHRRASEFRVHLLDQLLHLGGLALTDEGAGIRGGAILEHGGNGYAASRFDQGFKLCQGNVVGGFFLAEAGAIQPDKDGQFFFLCFYFGCASDFMKFVQRNTPFQKDAALFASAAGGRVPPCTRPCAGGARGRCPLDSRRGYAPDPEMRSHLHLACGRDGGWVHSQSQLPCWPVRQNDCGLAGFMQQYPI